MTTSTHPYHPSKPSSGSKGALTSYGRDGSSLIAHSCKIKLEELPGITLIDFNLEIFPLVYHLILRIGNCKEMWEGWSLMWDWETVERSSPAWSLSNALESWLWPHQCGILSLLPYCWNPFNYCIYWASLSTRPCAGNTEMNKAGTLPSSIHILLSKTVSIHL